MTTTFEIGLSLHTRLPNLIIETIKNLPVAKCGIDNAICIDPNETVQSLGVIPMTESKGKMVNRHFNPCADKCTECYKTN
jgi:hypothetical protein